MSKLVKTASHAELERTRQEAHEIISLLARELAETNDDTIMLPLGLDDESEEVLESVE
ncbi:hypothetical protein [Alkalimarinus alittae]|uniref:Uncharacterized protein n=1 Tax=Alkalimarinus alittae TaxID=2961619 RepID=A0ABY6MX73_9ALTE|nr:hypothetical protein [Alkalimarinus alittae]UZE94419.1 hypothetical protein NKI27_09955 [Alkalimarinus alittae]